MIVESLLETHYHLDRYEDSSKFAKGEIVKQFCDLTGKSEMSFYRARNKYLTNCGILLDGRKKPRLSPETQMIRLRELEIIAKMKHFFRGAPTKECQRVANNENLLIYYKDKWFGSIDRGLSEMGWNTKGLKQRRQAVKWKKPDYPMQLVMVDASVSQQYYQSFKGNDISMEKTITTDGKELWELDDDLLAKKYNMKKVWFFCLKEMFSGAYLILYVADLPNTGLVLGEQALGWIKLFTYAFQEKSNKKIPVCGVTDMIYSDRGSGLLSTAIEHFLTTLNPYMILKTHYPKEPWSKGPVEAQIGAWKRGPEKFFQREYFKSIHDLNDWTESFVVYNQKERFKIFSEGLKLRPNPLMIPSTKNIQDGLVQHDERVVRAWRTISIDNVQYRILKDVQVGEHVKIFKRGDKIVVKLPNGDSSGVEVFDDTRDKKEDYRESERIQSVKRIKKEATKFGKTINPKSIVPDISKEIDYNVPTTQTHKTHSVFPNVNDLGEIRDYILNETGITDKDTIDKIQKIVESCDESGVDWNVDFIVELTNKIRGEFVPFDYAQGINQ